MTSIIWSREQLARASLTKILAQQFLNMEMNNPDSTIRVFHHDFPKDFSHFEVEDIRYIIL